MNNLISSSKSIEEMILKCIKCGNNSHTDYSHRLSYMICDSCYDKFWEENYQSKNHWWEIWKE